MLPSPQRCSLKWSRTYLRCTAVCLCLWCTVCVRRASRACRGWAGSGVTAQAHNPAGGGSDFRLGKRAGASKGSFRLLMVSFAHPGIYRTWGMTWLTTNSISGKMQDQVGQVPAASPLGGCESRPSPARAFLLFTRLMKFREHGIWKVLHLQGGIIRWHH